MCAAGIGAHRLKGYTAEEILGRHFSLFYPPEDVAAGKPARELVIAAREGRVDDEGWRVRKDGSRFWASVIISAIRGDQGEITGFAKVTRNAEEALRESEARFRLVQSVTDYATPGALSTRHGVSLHDPQRLTLRAARSIRWHRACSASGQASSAAARRLDRVASVTTLSAQRPALTRAHAEPPVSLARRQPTSPPAFSLSAWRRARRLARRWTTTSNGGTNRHATCTSLAVGWIAVTTWTSETGSRRRRSRSVSVRRAVSGDETVPLFGVEIRHATKVWWPDAGLTKLDVARHYAAVAPQLRPWLRDRPLTAERCPDGFVGRCFFQKNFPAAGRLGLRTVALRAETTGRTVHYVLGGERRTLLVLVNLGCLTVHVANSRADALDHPDWLAFDLDPAGGFPQAARAASLLRAVLQDYGLRGYPKTSGGKGLHVLVPLVRGPDQDEVRSFAHAVGGILSRRAPELVTSVLSKAGRHGRLYLDALRNAKAQTIVPPYAVRHRPRAPVSTPLDWDEVDGRLEPATFNLRTIERRLAEPDPWAGFWNDRQRLPRVSDEVEVGSRPRRRAG